MRVYGQLKSDGLSSNAYSLTGSIKSVEFEVLLGILKKVESKNATLLTVWTFLISSMLVFSTVGMDSGRLSNSSMAWAMIVASIPFLLFSLSGTHQLDNFSEPVKSAERCDRTLQEKMVEELMLDALRKEQMFFISKLGAQILLLVFFGVGFLSLLLTSQCNALCLAQVR